MADEINDVDRQKVSAAARLFDVRRVIGGLFVVYGVVITLLGFFDGKAEIDKAQGVRINLWMGLAMLVLGLLFLLWLRLSPPPEPDLGEPDRPEPTSETPAGT
jgi:quinol-cytochrome oxidoreductase complex cytochrome b subunit